MRINKINSICVLVFAFFYSQIIYASSHPSKEIILEIKEGEIKLEDLLLSCRDLANSVSMRFINKDIVGKIIEIKGKKYEIRYFSFEDTTGKLSKDLSFRNYIMHNHLEGMTSTATSPLPSIHFESFDFRKAQINDGVYFSMALRPLTDKDAN